MAWARLVRTLRTDASIGNICLGSLLLIISRSPFRQAFGGGGTDYPTWSNLYGGLVLNATLDKFCYVSLRRLPGFFEYRTRAVWSQVEQVNSNYDLRHPAIRALFEYFNDPDTGYEIHHDADLPGRSGMGTSSSFMVALVNAMWEMHGVGKCDPYSLANTAITIERDWLRETVGIQDTVAAAYGGVNLIKIDKDGDFTIYPTPRDRHEELSAHILLLFTGFTRHASEIAVHQVASMMDHQGAMFELMNQADRTFDILCSNAAIEEIGDLLERGWQIKRNLSNVITNPRLDEIHDAVLNAGATACRLIGAGGGGVFQVFVKPEKREIIKNATNLLEIPSTFVYKGSEIIFSNEEGTVASSLDGWS
jgi:D-glycero-alpha-D-manno-heptose-7-phosphate kinase